MTRLPSEQEKLVGEEEGLFVCEHAEHVLFTATQVYSCREKLRVESADVELSHSIYVCRP